MRTIGYYIWIVRGDFNAIRWLEECEELGAFDTQVPFDYNMV